MRTFDFLWFYTTFIRLRPGAPLAHLYTVDELDGRCRTSTALFLRLWPMKIAVGFGIWRKTGLGPHEMFRRVFGSREIPLTGDVEKKVREAVAANAPDPTDEWQILQMLDLDS